MYYGRQRRSKLDSSRFGSLWQAHVPGTSDRRRYEGRLRTVALADFAAPVANLDLPAQVRCGAAERELGHHGGSLRGQVSSAGFSCNCINLILEILPPLVSPRRTCCCDSASTTWPWRRNRTVTRSGASRLWPPIRSSIRGRSSTIWRC